MLDRSKMLQMVRACSMKPICAEAEASLAHTSPHKFTTVSREKIVESAAGWTVLECSQCRHKFRCLVDPECRLTFESK